MQKNGTSGVKSTVLRGVGTPFVVIEQRPMQIADQRYFIAYDSDDFLDMQTQKFTAADVVATMGVAIVATSAQGDAVFGDD